MSWLEPVHTKHPDVSYADLYTLAGEGGGMEPVHSKHPDVSYADLYSLAGEGRRGGEEIRGAAVEGLLHILCTVHS